MTRAIRQALRSMRRSPYQALAAVLVLFLTFFLGFSLVLFLLGSHKALQYFESRPQVTAFFTKDTTLGELQVYEQQMRALPSVQDVTLITQEEALEIYKEQSGNDPVLLELVTADILPPSLEVSAKNIDDLGEIAEQMKTFAGIDEVVYQGDVVESLRLWTRTLRQVGLGVLALFTFTSMVVIVVITSIRVSSKKHEVRVTRLMGGTQWYILSPFLAEGALYGLIGATIAWAAVYVVLLYATPSIQAFVGEVALLPVPPVLMVLLWVGGGCAGALLGIIASTVSARRFVRV